MSDTRVLYGLPLDPDAWHERVLQLNPGLDYAVQQVIRVLVRGFREGNTLHMFPTLAEQVGVTTSTLRRLVRELDRRGILFSHLESGMEEGRPRRTAFTALEPTTKNLTQQEQSDVPQQWRRRHTEARPAPSPARVLPTP